MYCYPELLVNGVLCLSSNKLGGPRGAVSFIYPIFQEATTLKKSNLHPRGLAHILTQRQGRIGVDILGARDLTTNPPDKRTL